MIELKLINDTPIVLNSDLIEFIEATPDTVITLSTGKKMIVRESVREIVDKIIDYRRHIGIVVRELKNADEPGCK